MTVCECRAQSRSVVRSRSCTGIERLLNRRAELSGFRNSEGIRKATLCSARISEEPSRNPEFEHMGCDCQCMLCALCSLEQRTALAPTSRTQATFTNQHVGILFKSVPANATVAAVSVAPALEPSADVDRFAAAGVPRSKCA